MTDRETQSNIEKYINGKLSGKEEDELWIKFLKNPSWYEYFDTYLHLVSLAN